MENVQKMRGKNAQKARKYCASLAEIARQSATEGEAVVGKFTELEESLQAFENKYGVQQCSDFMSASSDAWQTAAKLPLIGVAAFTCFCTVRRLMFEIQELWNALNHGFLCNSIFMLNYAFSRELLEVLVLASFTVFDVMFLLSWGGFSL